MGKRRLLGTVFVGQLFGKLRVLNYAGKGPRGVSLWLCICQCGTTKTWTTGQLRGGLITRCRACGYAERKFADPIERFWSFVDKSNACWEWLGAKNKHGYGVFTSKQANTLAHRFSWKIKFGDPKTNCVLHHCDNPSCVNPEHLFIGTRKDNNLDKVRKFRNGKKLNWDAVLDIRRLFKQGGITKSYLARHYGVSRREIYFVLSNEHWNEDLLQNG